MKSSSQIVVLIFSQVKVQQVISLLWVIFEPILYGLIGAAIHIDYLDGSTVGKLKSVSLF